MRFRTSAGMLQLIGAICHQDKQLNDQALIDGGRLLSAYKVAGRKIYVVTEWNRSVTTMMMAEDY